MSTVKIDTKKYENVVLYFTKYCNNSYLGTTKLNKLFYYLDFISYRDRKETVTKDIYIHRKYGPVPSSLEAVLSDLSKEKKIKIETSDYKNGETYSFQPLVEPDMSVFDAEETKLLENICTEFNLWKTETIVNQTHLEAPWFYSKPYEEVDYKYSSDIEFFQA